MKQAQKQIGKCNQEYSLNSFLSFLITSEDILFILIAKGNSAQNMQKEQHRQQRITMLWER